MYDSRIARWLTTDPEGQFASPYIAMGGDPINGIDKDGGEADWHKDNNGKLVPDDGDQAIDPHGFTMTFNEGVGCRLIKELFFKINCTIYLLNMDVSKIVYSFFATSNPASSGVS